MLNIWTRRTGRHSLSALLLWVLSASAWPQAETVPSPAEAGDVVAGKIVVEGQRPGPGLWKVSKGDHILWVFGTYSPLPKNMAWRAREVETILAQAQEYLQPPGATAEVGFFRQLTMLPFALGFKKNTDGATLKDLLPESDYARWLVLKKKYIGDDQDIERERPIFVAATLFSKGLEQAGLAPGGQELRDTLEKIARKNKIRMTSAVAKLEIDDPVRMLRDFKKMPLDDAACFANTLARLEDDIDAMRVRAHAWAKGDLQAIQKLGYADRDGACDSAVLNSALMQSRPGLKSVLVQMQESWLAAAEKSLAANTSTFATLPLKDLLDPKGYLAVLQAKGYVVQQPD